MAFTVSEVRAIQQQNAEKVAEKAVRQIDDWLVVHAQPGTREAEYVVIDCAVGAQARELLLALYVTMGSGWAKMEFSDTAQTVILTYSPE